MKAYPSYRSEPTIVISKPAVTSTIPSLCCATSAESSASSESFQEEGSLAAPNLLQATGAFVVSDSKSPTTDRDQPKDKTAEPSGAEDILSSSYSSLILQNSGELKKNVETPRKVLKDDDHNTFGQTEFVPLSPLHIDSTLFEAAESSDLVKYISVSAAKASVSADNENSLLFRDTSPASADCSQLIDALDIQSPVAFRLNSSITVQSTPFSGKEQAKLPNTLQSEKKALKEPLLGKTSKSSQHGSTFGSKCPMKVADHVQRFNMLTINSPKVKARSPLKFQRTPVLQSVWRFNFLNQRKEARSGWCATHQGSTITKAPGLKSGQFNEVQQHPQHSEVFCSPPDDAEVSSKPNLLVSPQKHANSRHSALGDLTNTVAPKTKGTGLSTKSGISEAAKSVLVQESQKAYRGSPKNPLTTGMLLSALKPIDL